MFSVNCQWDVWAEWSTCSVSCGQGNRSTSRRIKEKEKHGGEKCYGRLQRFEKCNDRPCPGKLVILKIEPFFLFL